MMPLVLDQCDYPKLPKKGMIVRVRGTKLGSPSKELAAAIIVAVCANVGQWEQISKLAMMPVVNAHPDIKNFTPQDIADALWGLNDMGVITLSIAHHMTYITPNPAFGRYILTSNIIAEAIEAAG
jgi:hypothetical protein